MAKPLGLGFTPSHSMQALGKHRGPCSPSAPFPLSALLPVGPWSAAPMLNRCRSHRMPDVKVMCVPACTTEPVPLAQQLSQMTIEKETDAGKVVIRAVAPEDSMGACVVLCRAFAGTPEEVGLTDAKKYIDKVVNNPPTGVLFVARIFPNDPSLLPPNQESRLIGTVALSLHEDTLQQIPTLPPPANTAYLSNMAVDSQFRRLGVATALMMMCDQAARAAGLKEIYLHVRQGDDRALSLYTSAGYQEVARDSYITARLKNVRPRVLLRKQT